MTGGAAPVRGSGGADQILDEGASDAAAVVDLMGKADPEGEP